MQVIHRVQAYYPLSPCSPLFPPPATAPGSCPLSRAGQAASWEMYLDLWYIQAAEDEKGEGWLSHHRLQVEKFGKKVLVLARLKVFPPLQTSQYPQPFLVLYFIPRSRATL